MSIPKDIERENPAVGEWAILSGYRGSIAHGMYVPNDNPNSIDDKDTMTVCIPPADYYHGLKEMGSRGTVEIKVREWDIVCYEYRKFVRLLIGGNPNVISLLWLKPNGYINITPAGQLLIDSRDLFVGKHVYKSFVGYAHAQLYKMTHQKFEGYMGAKRKLLVEKYGYDTKNAAHLIRLLRMAIEFLSTGEFIVERHDAAQLLEIKRGEWTVQQVEAEAEKLFDTANEALVHSILKNGVDAEEANRLCLEIYRTHIDSKP